jgi:hypothetical protein
VAAHHHDDPVFARYRIKPGRKAFSLDDIDPQEKTCFPHRKAAEKQFEEDVEAIVEIQNAKRATPVARTARYARSSGR